MTGGMLSEAVHISTHKLTLAGNNEGDHYTVNAAQKCDEKGNSTVGGQQRWQ